MKVNNQIVYIKMLEAVETLIPVKAKHVETNVFEILSNKDMDLENDVTSIYQFYPTDIVRCKVIDNMLIADELISSKFPNRGIYQLIYAIVDSLGEIQLNELHDLKKEVDDLIRREDIVQKNHPVIKKWLQKIARYK